MGPQDMMRAIIANLPEKTGKTIGEWVKIVKRDGPAAAVERVSWLKNAHKLGSITAQIIVMQAEGSGDVYENPKKLVNNLFDGPRADLKKIYDRVLTATKGLANAKPKPCMTYVPLYHRVQFAIVKPGGREHVDLYLALGKTVPENGRLERLKVPDSRMSHRVRLRSPQEVDREVRNWLKLAYERSG